MEPMIELDSECVQRRFSHSSFGCCMNAQYTHEIGFMGVCVCLSVCVCLCMCVTAFNKHLHVVFFFNLNH